MPRDPPIPPVTEGIQDEAPLAGPSFQVRVRFVTTTDVRKRRFNGGADHWRAA